LLSPWKRCRRRRARFLRNSRPPGVVRIRGRGRRHRPDGYDSRSGPARSSGRRNRSALLHRATRAHPRRCPQRRCGHHGRRSGRHRSDRGPGATGKAWQGGSGARCDRREACGRRPISCTDAWQVRLFVYTYYGAPGLSRVSRGGGEKGVSGLFFEQALLALGWAREVRLTLDRGRLVSVETGVSAQPGDERHRIGLPGMPDLHSHAFQRGMAGLTEIRGSSADGFWTWRDLMYRFVGRMTADDIEAVAAQAYVEMLEAGFTRVGEFHYIHHDVSGAPYSNIGELAERIAASAQASGIGLTLLPVFYAHAGFGNRAPDRGQHRFINDVDGFARLLEATRSAVAGQQGAVVGLAPHSLRAVTPEELMPILQLDRNSPVHIHIAEQIREVDECLAWSGQRPLQWLFDHVAVDRRWCLIHATHATADELRLMAESGAVAGLCP